MQEHLMSLVTQLASEVITILVGAAVSALIAKAYKFLDQLKKKNQLPVINHVIDSVIAYAEVEMKGSQGRVKRDWAIEKAVQILATKGIKVSEDEVAAGIEQGLNVLNRK